jgi:hypothetical protein
MMNRAVAALVVFGCATFARAADDDKISIETFFKHAQYGAMEKFLDKHIGH